MRTLGRPVVMVVVVVVVVVVVGGGGGIVAIAVAEVRVMGPLIL